jgi:flagellar biosynthesis protein FliQ
MVHGTEAVMEMSQVIDWSREAIRMALLLGGPLLLAALAVGVIVGIFQTLTQMHEPVVGQIPRLVAVLLVVIAVLPWLLSRWVGYAVELISSIPEML